MKSVHKTVQIEFTPQQMFELVADIASYPKFLPWCNQSRVLETRGAVTRAEVGLSFAGLQHAFVTENTNIPFHRIDMRLIYGPFSHLEGTWLFNVSGSSPGTCMVELRLIYKIKSLLLNKLIGPAFDKIAHSLVDAFVKRAHQVYR